MRSSVVLADRFELGDVIGSGGMGEVYRATDRTNGEIVALKIVRSPSTSGGQRFARESRLLAGLSHPAIVRYVEHGFDGSVAYLAMEWLEGEDLSARLRAGPLAVDEALELGERLAGALGSAHAAGIVHRDVKPSNVFLVAGDVRKAKLLDLGVARILDGPDLTLSGMIVGTPAYMAPEQACGERALDVRTDVFALGVLLYECLVGEKVFSGGPVAAVLAKVVSQEVPPLSERRPDAPPELSRLVAQMMAKEPKQRPPDGRSVARVLSTLPRSGTGSAPRARRRSLGMPLTSKEQRLLCVLMGRPDRSRVETLVAPQPGEAPAPETKRATVPAGVLSDLAQERGAELLRLADGTLLCTWRGRSGDLVHHAVRAARLALALADAAPEMSLALATGRWWTGEPLPMAELVERAAASLGPAGIEVDEVSAGLIEGHFEIEHEGAGRRLRGSGAIRGERTLLGRRTPFVGRNRELANLEAFFDECVEEPMNRPILVTGDAGTGKSRLVGELLDRLGSGVTVWRAHGDPVSAGSSLGLVAGVLEGASGAVAGLPVAARHRKLRALVDPHLEGEAAERVVEMIAEIVGVPFDAAAGSPLAAARRDARLMGDRKRLAFEELLLARASAGPLVLVLDDLQWGDLPSVSFVDSALRVLGARPMLVFGIGRPELHERFPRLFGERGVQELRLEPLRRRAASALVSSALGDGRAEAVVERIVERGAGNAFALEELVRAEVAGHGDEAPASLLGLVEARLGRLPKDARSVLRAASVYGETFWERGVSKLLGDPFDAATVDDWLALLIAEDLVFRREASRFEGEREVSFRSGIVREASHAMLTPGDRRAGHRSAAMWLEARGERDALTLAEHWERGDAPDRAARAYLKAAEQALEGDDLLAVLSRAERGLACGADGELAGRLHVVQAEARRWRGELAEAATHGEAALARFAPGTNEWWSAAGALVAVRGPLGAGESLVALADRLLEQAADEPSAAIVAALARAGAVLRFAGHAERAGELLARAERLGRPLASGDPLVGARLASIREQRALAEGDMTGYLRAAEQCEELASAAGDARVACFERANVGFALLELGAYERAERTLRDVLRTAHRLNLGSVRLGALHNLGGALTRLGKLEEARKVEREAVELAAAQGDRRIEGISRSYLAEALRRAGHPQDALREASVGADTLESAAPGLHAFALAVRARAELALGDAVAALESAARAQRLLEERGAVEEGEAFVRLVHVEALLATGDDERAGACLSAAADRVADRAARITDEALRQTFLTDIEEHERTLRLARARGYGS